MKNKYAHLLAPLKVGNVVLKNRFLATKALPHFLQGPETFPSESTIAYYANIARNGAAVVTCKGAYVDMPSRAGLGAEDMKRMPIYDLKDPSVGNYFAQMADAVHFYGAKMSVSLHGMEPTGFNISEVTAQSIAHMDPEVYRIPLGREMTREDMNKMIQEFVELCKFYKRCGFDMCNLYMSYRASILACALSPAINHRTDEYGGSVENRCRFPLELCAAIKKACGQDWLIEAQISGAEDKEGFTLEDTVEFAKLAEGKIDIFHIRGKDGSEAHPTGFNSVKEQPVTLKVAEAIKKSGAKVITAPNGGYQDLELCESFIAEGKTDMVAMGRSFICDYDYFRKALEGRGEDVTPCIRCNKCHVPSLDGPWVSICSVNPRQGINQMLKRFDKPAAAPQKVAVIGGGPAGLAAAMYAAEAGHAVTLFEKTAYLGGQLYHADFSSFKWPLRDYKNWLVREVYKLGVDVKTETAATPELIGAGDYDVVIAATGAAAKLPQIKGADSQGVWTACEVYGREKELGKSIVLVGGSETGTETGMYLAENGHQVTVLTRQGKLASDATPIHYYEMFSAAWEAMDNFSAVCNAKTTAVTGTSVTYTDAQGAEHTIDCDNVVLCGGVQARADEAMSFYNSAGRFFQIGDCRKPGNVHECSRQAYAAVFDI